MTASLSTDKIDDLLFSARVGDLEDIEAFFKEHAAETRSTLLSSIVNQDGNTLLHYSAANGHLEVVNYLLPHASLSFLLTQNSSGNTALHWAGLNGHLALVHALIDRIDHAERDSPQEAATTNKLKPDEERKIWDIRNKAGRGPMSEAQMNQREDVVQFLLERMVEGPEDDKAQQQKSNQDSKAEQKSNQDSKAADVQQGTENLSLDG